MFPLAGLMAGQENLPSSCWLGSGAELTEAIIAIVFLFGVNDSKW